jgi:hypothetical protein
VGAVTTTAPANYTGQITDAGIVAGVTLARTSSAQRELEAASDDPGTFALSASVQWAANTVAVRPA